MFNSILSSLVEKSKPDLIQLFLIQTIFGAVVDFGSATTFLAVLSIPIFHLDLSSPTKFIRTPNLSRLRQKSLDGRQSRLTLAAATSRSWTNLQKEEKDLR